MLMKRGTSLLFFLMLAPGAWSQGHPEASNSHVTSTLENDSCSVVTEKIYPVGDELQITRIGTARLRCYCAGADTAEDQASPQAGQSR